MNDLNVLVESLGVTGMLRFLEQFDHGEVVTIPQKNMKKKKPNLRTKKSVKCTVSNTLLTPPRENEYFYPKTHGLPQKVNRPRTL